MSYYSPIIQADILREKAKEKKKQFFARYQHNITQIPSIKRLPFAGKYMLAGKNSILIAVCLVLAFMLFYYKGFGIVANIAMILNAPFIISIISTPSFKEYDVVNLTLAGIFGLVLTIGMAIDANVIIFERIKEEFSKGKKALDAIDIGYKKAFRTILDSNITTLLAAIALFSFGGELTRNFGLMLIVGLLCSMFTSIFITKTIIMTYFKFKPSKKLCI